MRADNFFSRSRSCENPERSWSVSLSPNPTSPAQPTTEHASPATSSRPQMPAESGPVARRR